MCRKKEKQDQILISNFMVSLRLSQTCLRVFECDGTGQQWPASGAGTLGAGDLCHTACSISPLERGHHQLHHRADNSQTAE